MPRNPHKHCFKAFSNNFGIPFCAFCVTFATFAFAPVFPPSPRISTFAPHSSPPASQSKQIRPLFAAKCAFGAAPRTMPLTYFATMPLPSHAQPVISHRLAVVGMVVLNALWATAGVLARQIEFAKGVEVTFWRSVFTAIAMTVMLHFWRGADFWRSIHWRDRALWFSAVCWSIMFTAFMMAMSFTTVANVLIMVALGPVFTALSSRIFLKHRLPVRTWMAIVLAVAGVIYMYAAEFKVAHPRELLGLGTALLVPFAASFQWVLMHREKQRAQAARAHAVASAHAAPPAATANAPAATAPAPAPEKRDMLPAIIIGAILSALYCLPFVLPPQASAADMGWLAVLGTFQLALPCALIVIVSRALPAPELALLGLLETIFGILFTWWGAGEVPSSSVIIGGSIVIGALALNELLGARQRNVSTT